MKVNYAAAVAATVGAMAFAQNTTNSTAFSLDSCCTSVQDATIFSLIYGLPLIAFFNQTGKVFNITGGANQINAQTGLASLSGAAVVKPNVDTLYSRVIIDLSQSDLVLTVPNITDRFWIFPFYDVYGNNFANIYPGNVSTPGQYLLRRAEDAYVPPGLQVTNVTTADCIPKYQGVINFPGTYGTMLIRLLLKYNTTENLEIVNRYQNETSLIEVPRTLSRSDASTPSSWTTISKNGTLLLDSEPRQILSTLAAILPSNLPIDQNERYRVSSLLGLAGLHNGRYSSPSSLDLSAAYTNATNAINTITALPQNINNVGNNWQLAYPPEEGKFGNNYASRALVAQTGYQQLVPWITLYPGFNGSSFTSYTLGANESFLFTFSGRPPIERDGFWSLTIYGADQYLIPNDLGRFEVGDRGNLTFTDGRPVYGTYEAGETPLGADGMFKILMQRADVAPPSNWTNK